MDQHSVRQPVLPPPDAGDPTLSPPSSNRSSLLSAFSGLRSKSVPRGLSFPLLDPEPASPQRPLPVGESKWKNMLTHYFAKPDDKSQRGLDGAPLPSPYSVEGMQLNEDVINEGDHVPMRKQTGTDAIGVELTAHDDSDDFVPKPIDAVTAAQGHTLDSHKLSPNVLSPPPEAATSSSVASMLSSYLPSIPSIPSLPKLSSYFPSRKPSGSLSESEADGPRYDDIPIPPIDPESEKLLTYLKFIREGSSKAFEAYVQRTAEKMVAMEVAVKATDRRNSELEARIAALTKALHHSEARHRADDEEKTALMSTIRHLRTQIALTGADSSVHKAALAVSKTMERLKGDAGCDSPSEPPAEWTDVETMLTNLLAEVRELVHKTHLMHGGSGLDVVVPSGAFVNPDRVGFLGSLKSFSRRSSVDGNTVQSVDVSVSVESASNAWSDTESAVRATTPPPQPVSSTSRGIRILALDGGGVRGLLELEMLRRLEKDTGKRVFELFDLICGTSTGGYLAVMLGLKRYSIDECVERYHHIRQTFGGQSAIFSEFKRFTVGQSHDHRGMEAFLQSDLGDDEMRYTAHSPKVFVVSAAVNMFPPQPYLFRNYEFAGEAFSTSEFLGTSKVKLWEAVRATTAAPTYHSPVTIGSQAFTDGAIIAQNPTCIALCEASLLWPSVPIDCVVSLGTGQLTIRQMKQSSVMSWVRTVLELALSPVLTHKFASTVIGPGRYFRFDPDSGEGDVELTEDNIEVVKKMLDTCGKYIERHRHEFLALAKLLSPTTAISHSRRMSSPSVDKLVLSMESWIRATDPEGAFSTSSGPAKEQEAAVERPGDSEKE